MGQIENKQQNDLFKINYNSLNGLNTLIKGQGLSDGIKMQGIMLSHVASKILYIYRHTD